MNFHIITIIPEAIEGYLNSSILGRAQEKGLIKINFINPRDFVSSDKKKWSFRKVDDRPFGGGPGMVMKVEPIVKAIESILNNVKSKKIPLNPPLSRGKKTNSLPDKGGLGWVSKIKNFKIILFSPAGKQFDQKLAINLANPTSKIKRYTDIVFVCGRYEGVDARLKSILKDCGFDISELSIGPYVLTGGELPSAIIVDAISRYIPGVLGKDESLELARQKGEIERGIGIPVYTRPEIYESSNPAERGKKYRVPKILLSGDQKKIIEWKTKHAKK